MNERKLKHVGKPKLLVECENLCTLLAVAKVVNESGLNARVLMEYELAENGGNNKNVELKDVEKQ